VSADPLCADQLPDQECGRDGEFHLSISAPIVDCAAEISEYKVDKKLFSHCVCEYLMKRALRFPADTACIPECTADVSEVILPVRAEHLELIKDHEEAARRAVFLVL